MEKFQSELYWIPPDLNYSKFVCSTAKLTRKRQKSIFWYLCELERVGANQLWNWILRIIRINSEMRQFSLLLGSNMERNWLFLNNKAELREEFLKSYKKSHGKYIENRENWKLLVKFSLFFSCCFFFAFLCLSACRNKSSMANPKVSFI